ncbi:endonuclease MutS2, partial [Myxococcota bacterium]|nr:endonuclease MutS2 [Myxococcota bacterium]
MSSLNLHSRTLRDLKWTEVLIALAERTHTHLGERGALELKPLSSPERVKNSLSRIQEARLLKRDDTPLSMGSLDDLQPLLARAAKGSILGADELLSCARLMREASSMRRFLRHHQETAPQLFEYSHALTDESHLAARLENSIEPSGELKDGASGPLADLRQRTRSLNQEIKSKIEGYLDDHDFETYLRDDYVTLRNDRYVLPINASFRSQVPGIVHNASNSGQTIFVEPQAMVPLGNELAIAQSMVSEEELQILAEFSGFITDRAAALLVAIQTLGRLDLIAAQARLADVLEAKTPELLAPEGELVLTQLRHPLLILQGERVVASDVALEGEGRALVISGPNAGGKTVTLTATGLAALMVHCGMPIAAGANSKIPLYRGVSTAVGDAQDIAQHLSTFSAQVHTLRRIVDESSEGWLVLVDEIAADTDPAEGAALGAAILEALVDQRARVIVTTHLDEIKALGLVDERFKNARVGLDPKTLKPNYKLELGVAGVSNAIDIAAQTGLPEHILVVARQKIGGQGALSIALGRLDEQRRDSERVEEDLRDQLDKVVHERAALETELKKLAERERGLKKTVREEMAQEIDEARAEVSKLIAKLQAQPMMRKAQKAQKDLEQRAHEISKKIARTDAQDEASRRSKVAARPLRVGDKVRVATLGRDGEVLAVDKNAVLVAVGTMRTRVKFADAILLAG